MLPRLEFRDVQIIANFRPDYYEFAPVFSDVELVGRFERLLWPFATCLRLANINRAMELELVTSESVQRYLESDFSTQRSTLCDLIFALIRNRSLETVLRSLRREWFVPPEFQRFSYVDVTIPFSDGCWLTEPLLLALLLDESYRLAQKCGGFKRIIEVGAGSGLHLRALEMLFPDASLVGFENNESFASLGQSALAQSGSTNAKIFAQTYSPKEMVEVATSTLIVVTAMPDHSELEALKEIVGPGTYLQVPRRLYPDEFHAAYASDQYLQRRYSSFDVYLESSDYCCVTSVYWRNGKIVDRPFVYDVRFVPYRTETISQSGRGSLKAFTDLTAKLA